MATRFINTSIAGGALVALLALTGCTAGAQPEGANAAPASVNDTDLHFLAMMTPHHEQAVQMSDIVLAAGGVSEQTRDIALRIRSGQQEEIDIMLGWVGEWQQEPLLAQHAGHIANGMVTPEAMAALAALDGPEVEQTFLEEMIFHHEGAIAMTQDQIDNGGHPELRALAQQMIDVQGAEVVEMNGLLAR
ncbi:DUF305 domain-containing protein [Microterricola viridarii]|uniref:Uncharacterized conserved protein, DUF305 family n=1 Tax=Microterricola viridarii TaxID=412690 RepID=A0A1H1UGB8_9MICO|nr:DUF305 domain-containing protein [Microterricola viridarii]SDS71513.1 Uncharacterized conserved protein, DUF305 family [Microterricola viridarii]